MPVRFSFDEDTLQRSRVLLRNLPGGYEKALARSINRALSGMRTDAVKLTRESFTAKARPLRDSISFKRAKPSDLNGEFISRGSRLGLGEFAVRPRTDTTGRRRRRVTAKVRRGEPFEVKRGFVWNRGVFRRSGAARLPVEHMTGRAAPEMMEDPEVMEKLTDAANDRLEKRLRHETQALLEGHSK